ncbi:hypothetical protein AVEN_2298-1 [Araneus ventricosus]|uniref:Uncharacterized protein n=1 Tax=Araneus ventricosus TaxID=182803 RepID=A0A4Y2ALF8_ARAVE|nr:hypothetical protein AVEN_2298-1 [Araneus ventricosus]
MDFERSWISKLPTTPRRFSSDFRGLVVMSRPRCLKVPGWNPDFPKEPPKQYEESTLGDLEQLDEHRLCGVAHFRLGFLRRFQLKSPKIKLEIKQALGCVDINSLNSVTRVLLVHRSRGGLVVIRSWLRGHQVRNPILLKIRLYVDLLHFKSYIGGQKSSRWCGTEIWRGGASSGAVLVIKITRSVPN